MIDLLLSILSSAWSHAVGSIGAPHWLAVCGALVLWVVLAWLPVPRFIWCAAAAVLMMVSASSLVRGERSDAALEKAGARITELERQRDAAQTAFNEREQVAIAHIREVKDELSRSRAAGAAAVANALGRLRMQAKPSASSPAGLEVDPSIRAAEPVAAGLPSPGRELAAGILRLAEQADQVTRERNACVSLLESISGQAASPGESLADGLPILRAANSN